MIVGARFSSNMLGALYCDNVPPRETKVTKKRQQGPGASFGPVPANRAPTENYARRGRPSSYTKQLGDKIIESATMLLPLSECAHSAGVPANLAYKWLERGETESYEASPDLVDFAIRYREAVAKITKHVNVEILKSDDHKLKLRLVEVAHQSSYTEVKRVEVTGANGGPIESKISPESMTSGELRKAISEGLARAAGANAGTTDPTTEGD